MANINRYRRQLQSAGCSDELVSLAEHLMYKEGIDENSLVYIEENEFEFTTESGITISLKG